MATHPSILAWRIPWTEEPGGYSPWGRKESDTTERLTHTQSLLYFFVLFLPILFLHHLALVMWFHDPFFGYITVYRTVLLEGGDITLPVKM